MKDYEYPIFFLNNRCVHCGAKDSLEKINMWGSVNRNKTYPINKLHCCKCGRDYFIRWEKDDKGQYNIPIAVSYNFIELFAEIFDSGYYSEEIMSR